MYKTIFFCLAILLIGRTAKAPIDCGNMGNQVFNEASKILKSSVTGTSYLQDNKDPDRYHYIKAFDRNLETAWCEGKDDDGIVEKIAFHFENAKKISILPGFGMSQYFKLNNRVKKALLKIYAVSEISGNQCSNIFSYDRLVKEMTLVFRDSMEMQDFDLNLENNSKGFVIILEIQEVYKGTKWRDTCIAEIK